MIIPDNYEDDEEIKEYIREQRKREQELKQENYQNQAYVLQRMQTPQHDQIN